MRIALAPLRAWRGDVAGNAARIRAARAEAARLGADLLVTPQGSLSGDLPADSAIETLAAETGDGGPGLLVGAPWAQGDLLHDAAILLDGGRVLARRARHVVARGEPFDPGPAPGPVAFRGLRLGLLLGMDRATPAAAETLAETGAELLLAIDADPGRPASRRVDAAVARVVETGLAFAFLNRLGGEAGQVCDGAGFVLNPDRSLAVQLAPFAGALALTDWARGADGWACALQPLAPDLSLQDEEWRALTLGVAEQAAREGRARALLLLTGDAATALRAAVAVEALGAERVSAVILPGDDTPPALAAAAEQAAGALGIACRIIPLAPAMAGFEAMLGMAPPPSRIRAMTLATLAERLGALVVAGPDCPGAHDPLAGLDPEMRAALAGRRAARQPSTPHDAEPNP